MRGRREENRRRGEGRGGRGGEGEEGRGRGGEVQSEGERRGVKKLPGVYGCRVTETHTRNQHSTLGPATALYLCSPWPPLPVTRTWARLLCWAAC